MEISGFGTVLLFILGGLFFIIVALFMGKLLRPNHPNEEKMTTYESGEEPVNNAWGAFNVRFYVIALIFILFEVELVFLFPWAIVFADADLITTTEGLWGWFALIETIIFVLILVLGLAYVWANGMLEWERPVIEKNTFVSQVPQKFYTRLNDKYS
ncbi:MAG: NADH-quinone oxidoreductase subunit A [Flammeovirgaceae bacterium]|jgi:NADH-quinone oxidoreductase subunit A|nr:NADH-quinone oxidoreductase subunit A [Flammeovirgaceae bacterium]|tara:strand:- start:8366 stop:8833 length:468 start_codon:yes stop_codon:yes gene_type:complete